MMSNVYQTSMIHCNMNMHHKGSIGKCFNYGLHNDACGLWRHLDFFFFLYLFRSIWLRLNFKSTVLGKRVILTMVLSYALCLNEKKRSKMYLWMRCQDYNSFPFPSKKFYWLLSCIYKKCGLSTKKQSIYKKCEMTMIFMTIECWCIRLQKEWCFCLVDHRILFWWMAWDLQFTMSQ